MADKVAALQQSLDVLGHVSDYEERRQTLEEHRNRLEATASPHLVAAITDADTGQLGQLHRVALNVDSTVLVFYQSSFGYECHYDELL